MDKTAVTGPAGINGMITPAIATTAVAHGTKLEGTKGVENGCSGGLGVVAGAAIGSILLLGFVLDGGGVVVMVFLLLSLQ
jgi:hypothetical protein